MKRILLIQTASIGDVILATPVAEKLHQYYPDASIDFLVKKGNESLFAHHPFIQKVWVWDKSTKKRKHLFSLFKDVFKENYDLVVNMQRFFSSGLITTASMARKRVGFKKNPLSIFYSKRYPHHISAKGTQHEIDRNLSLIASYTDQERAAVKLYPDMHDMAKVSPYKTVKYITISPASLWFTKQFPKEKWIEFLSQVDQELAVYFLGGKSDRALIDEIIERAALSHALNLAGMLSFLESAALMRDAQMNFVNDSAPMHLASSQNAKTAAIFCSTVPAFGFGPLSDQAYIIESGIDLACRPCGLHGYRQCPKEHFNCAYQINKDQLNKVLE